MKYSVWLLIKLTKSLLQEICLRKNSYTKKAILSRGWLSTYWLREFCCTIIQGLQDCFEWLFPAAWCRGVGPQLKVVDHLSMGIQVINLPFWILQDQGLNLQDWLVEVQIPLGTVPHWRENLEIFMENFLLVPRCWIEMVFFGPCHKSIDWFRIMGQWGWLWGI